MKIVFIDQNVYKDFEDRIEIIDPLRKMGEVTAYDDIPVQDEELYERASDADIIVLSIHQLSNELIARFKNLKLIQFMGIGYRNYADERFCISRNIKLLGIGEYGSNAVAEYTLGLTFSLLRGISEADRRMKKECWDMQGLLGGEICGSTFGIVGTGAIGRLVAEKISLLGGKVIATDLVPNQDLKDRYGVEYVDLPTLFASSDIVSCHLTHTKTTEKLISRELLSSMKAGAFFVNTSRAQVVDYGALYELLKEKRLAGAALDVYYSEPPQSYDLSKLENVVSTPHLGYYTKKSLENQLRKVVESIVQNF